MINLDVPERCIGLAMAYSCIPLEIDHCKALLKKH